MVMATAVTSAVAGCGGSGAPNTTAPPATVAPATSPPTTQNKAADEKLAKAALLDVEDLEGEMWTVDRSGAGDEGYGDVTDGCEKATEAMIETFGAADKAPSATSPAFIGDEADVSNKVTIFADEEQAISLGNALRADEMPACVKASILTGLRQAGLQPDEAAVTVSVEDDTPTVGDEHVAFRTVVTYDPSQIDPTAPTEAEEHDLLVFARVGRGWTSVDYRTEAKPLFARITPFAKDAVKKLETELADI
jgi:hypothetical protein